MAVFLFVYAVNFNGLPNFSYIGILIFPILALLVPKCFNNINFILSNKSFYRLLMMFLLFLGISLVPLVVHGTGETNLVFTIMHSVVSVPACMAISALIVPKNSRNNIKNLIFLLSFLLKVQVVFIILMLLNADIRDFVFSLIRSDSIIERMSVYKGSRGLGVAGSAAYGLATFLAINYVIYFFLLYVYRKDSFVWSDYFWMILSSVALLSAGRTAVLGIVILPVLLLVYSVYYKKIKVNKWFFSFLIFSLLILSLWYVYDFFELYKNPAIARYVFYVFEPIDLFLRTGSFEVTSLQGLNNMYFYPGDKTFIFGDGKYIADNGGYYGSVDAGYMRFILYGGIFYQAAVTLIFILFFYCAFKISNIFIPGVKLLLIVLFFMSLAFHYKGDFIMLSVAVNKIYLIVLFYMILLKKKAIKQS